MKTRDYIEVTLVYKDKRRSSTKQEFMLKESRLINTLLNSDYVDYVECRRKTVDKKTWGKMFGEWN